MRSLALGVEITLDRIGAVADRLNGSLEFVR